LIYIGIFYAGNFFNFEYFLQVSFDTPSLKILGVLSVCVYLIPPFSIPPFWFGHPPCRLWVWVGGWPACGGRAFGLGAVARLFVL